jgi:hypothetical protein
MSAEQPIRSDAEEQIRSDIERTRAELAETASAIAAKLDVKRQARIHATEVGIAAGAAAAIAALLVVWRVTHRSTE